MAAMRWRLSPRGQGCSADNVSGDPVSKSSAGLFDPLIETVRGKERTSTRSLRTDLQLSMDDQAARSTPRTRSGRSRRKTNQRTAAKRRTLAMTARVETGSLCSAGNACRWLRDSASRPDGCHRLGTSTANYSGQRHAGCRVGLLLQRLAGTQGPRPREDGRMLELAESGASRSSLTEGVRARRYGRKPHRRLQA